MSDSNIIVKTEFGDVTVHKMPLVDYAELLKALDNTPKSIYKIIGGVDQDKLKGMDNMEYLALLPTLLASAWPDLIAIVAVPTDKDAKFMAKLDFADAVDVLAAILELNDVPRIVASIKKMLALKSKLVTAKPEPEQT